MKRLVLATAILLSLLCRPTASTYAQTSIYCGDIIEAKFSQELESHTYSIALAPGDMLEISAKPLGDTLKIGIALWGPSNVLIATNADNTNYTQLQTSPTAKTKVLSARGDYIIQIANAQIDLRGSDATQVTGAQGGVGLYTLYIGCTLRDGTVINPGESAQPAEQPNTGDNGSTDGAAFSGNGFPGLAPVDFSKATTLKLPRSGEVEGEISPDSGDVLGFTFDATDGQQFDLSFARITGNLNLGLVILSSDNKVYFQTSLVASSELTTKLMLPAGKYTLGIFKIDLVAPATAETTEFAITLK